MQELRYVRAGDIHLDFESVELIEDTHSGFDVVADVRRYDGRNTLVANIYGREIDLRILECLILNAKEPLEPLFDGTPLEEACSTQIIVS